MTIFPSNLVHKRFGFKRRVYPFQNRTKTSFIEYILISLNYKHIDKKNTIIYRIPLCSKCEKREKNKNGYISFWNQTFISPHIKLDTDRQTHSYSSRANLATRALIHYRVDSNCWRRFRCRRDSAASVACLPCCCCWRRRSAPLLPLPPLLLRPLTVLLWRQLVLLPSSAHHLSSSPDRVPFKFRVPERVLFFFFRLYNMLHSFALAFPCTVLSAVRARTSLIFI